MDATVQHTDSGALPVRQLCHTGRVPNTTEQSSQDDNAQVRDSGLSRGGDTTMTPSQAAEVEAKKTFELFILWSKRTLYFFTAFLLVVVVGCNNGVETGKGATGSKYNGEVYAPTNIGEDK